MGNKINKTKKQENFTTQAITCGYVEIPELYSPLIFRSKIGCIYFKKERSYYIGDRKGDHVDWLDDSIGRKNIIDQYPDLVENEGDSILLKDGQKSKCCTNGNKHITYFKSSTGWLENGWMFDINNLCININYCPFCGNKLYNK